MSKKDTHLKLPYITQKIKLFKKNDFSVFKNKKSFFAMTAHIVFKAIDKNNCITHSKKGLNI